MTDLSRDPEFFALLTRSHARFLGAPLVPEGADADWLHAAAPFAVLAHDAGDDPRFIYANRAALACFEYERSELIGLPSRLSAEAPDRAERQALLDAVARDGSGRGYRGLRVAKSGRRFWIEQAVVWRLERDGTVLGQAAAFSKWREA